MLRPSRSNFSPTLKLVRPSVADVLAADTLRELVALTVFGLLILAVVTHDRLYSQPLYLPGLEILWLSVLEL